MANRSRTKSIFGGPLSTRHLCKAALQGEKRVESTKEVLNINGKKGIRKEVQKLNTRAKDLTASSHQRPTSLMKKRPMELNSRKKKIQDGTLIENGNSLAKKKRPVETKGITKAGVKRKLDVETRNVKRIAKPFKPASGSLFDKMRSKAGFSFQNRQKPSVTTARAHSNRTIDDYDEMEDFIDDEHTDDQWRSELRKVTNYNPAKFKDDGRDDKSMEVSLRQCWKEEQRSSKLGRLEDQREIERETKRRAIRNR